MTMTPAARAAGLFLVALVSAGCGQVQNMAQGGSCGLHQPDENVENPVEGETASVKGYEGKSLAEAEALADSRGHVLRVVGEDNNCRGLSDDYSFGRVNVYVEDGVVEAVEAF
jgi:hypothetical protein